ncbi:MAG: hypothetical protein H0T84_08605 [Tatlockia sp.]|nr:hypothetical protein [Tatlockia sp.]
MLDNFNNINNGDNNINFGINNGSVKIENKYSSYDGDGHISIKPKASSKLFYREKVINHLIKTSLVSIIPALIAFFADIAGIFQYFKIDNSLLLLLILFVVPLILVNVVFNNLHLYLWTYLFKKSSKANFLVYLGRYYQSSSDKKFAQEVELEANCSYPKCSGKIFLCSPPTRAAST